MQFDYSEEDEKFARDFIKKTDNWERIPEIDVADFDRLKTDDHTKIQVAVVPENTTEGQLQALRHLLFPYSYGKGNDTAVMLGVTTSENRNFHKIYITHEAKNDLLRKLFAEERQQRRR